MKFNLDDCITNTNAMYVRILLSVCILLIGFCSLAQGTYSSQPEVSARVANVVQVNGLRFKDLNKNGKLDPYEDWRLPVDKRIDDLVQHMTIPEKVGMLLINTMNSESGGKLSERGVQFIQEEKMTRFIFRNTITENPRPTGGGGFGGAQIKPKLVLSASSCTEFMNCAASKGYKEESAAMIRSLSIVDATPVLLGAKPE